MDIISDEEFRQGVARAQRYVGVVLLKGPSYDRPDAKAIILQHAKRNMSLGKTGKFPIVLPAAGDGPVRGMGVFAVSEEEARAIMDADPGVMAGLFTYELHPVNGFPGASLPDRGT